MQLVGLHCSVCAEVIRVAPDAGGCPACKVAFHLTCCSTTGRCPRCGCDFVAATHAEAASSAARIEAQVARGHRIVLWCGAALLALHVFVVAETLLTNPDALPVEIVRVLALLAVLMAVYLKFGAARVYLKIVLAVNALLSAAVLLRGLQDDDSALIARTVVVLIVYGASLFFLSSGAAALYFAQQREVT